MIHPKTFSPTMKRRIRCRVKFVDRLCARESMRLASVLTFAIPVLFCDRLIHCPGQCHIFVAFVESASRVWRFGCCRRICLIIRRREWRRAARHQRLRTLGNGSAFLMTGIHVAKDLLGFSIAVLAIFKVPGRNASCVFETTVPVLRTLLFYLAGNRTIQIFDPCRLSTSRTGSVPPICSGSFAPA